jgi:hypothetical protein
VQARQVFLARPDERKHPRAAGHVDAVGQGVRRPQEPDQWRGELGAGAELNERGSERGARVFVALGGQPFGERAASGGVADGRQRLRDVGPQS